MGCFSRRWRRSKATFCSGVKCRRSRLMGLPPREDCRQLPRRQTPVPTEAKHWKFTYPTECDRDEHRAVQAAASFIREHARSFPGGRAPTDPSQLAILAIKTYEVFLNL